MRQSPWRHMPGIAHSLMSVVSQGCVRSLSSGATGSREPQGCSLEHLGAPCRPLLQPADPPAGPTLAVCAVEPLVALGTVSGHLPTDGPRLLDTCVCRGRREAGGADRATAREGAEHTGTGLGTPTMGSPRPGHSHCSWGHLWHLFWPQAVPMLPQQSSCLVRPGRGLLPHFGRESSVVRGRLGPLPLPTACTTSSYMPGDSGVTYGLFGQCVLEAAAQGFLGGRPGVWGFGVWQQVLGGG